ncbi:DEAD/DEAH box helicase [Mycoplasmopsis verecunda]|uniref:Type III restriction enzyme n=1 Tax=Mycoplasmopsis verecunda TaxID=171291 RepID=A0A1T4KFN2_9BACT|nr:DEAD/DEAH box helicase family protein [Mycoplasmopsis verecunda]WPB54892.1 DEAD/DEAH box helicase family protein [Mycoplasmopsis verecunda]SJZ41229.1 type III restriction enzyme [Mycoplasmopsis verecunda]
MKLTNVQEKAVDEIVSYFDPTAKLGKNAVTFKAPTGSGKTFMMANVIDKLITNTKNDNINLVFVVATLSDAELPKQMQNALLQYLPHFTSNNIKDVKYMQSPSSNKKGLKVKDYVANITVNSNEVLVLGLASFGKNRIFTEQGVLDQFLQQFKFDETNTKLVYIRDEAHKGSSKFDEDSKKADALFRQHALFTIEMTATPNNPNNKVVEITLDELREDDVKLLKHQLVYNEDLEYVTENDIKDMELLQVAIDKFKELRNQYTDSENKYGLRFIQPAMLIQISDKNKDKIDEFDQKLDEIEAKLYENGLRYAKYFSDEKILSDQRGVATLQDISNNNSQSCDVVIFKVGPAVGWNIPRACMLVQLRSVCSEALSVQTIGRIMRNPSPSYTNDENWNEKNPAYKYYIYSNHESKYDDNFYSFRLKDEYRNEVFLSGKINREQTYGFKNRENYHNKILNLIKADELIKWSKDLIEEFETNGVIIHEKEKITASDNSLKWIIKSTIKNSIELAIWCNRLIDRQKNYWNSTIRAKISNKIKEILEQIKDTHPYLTYYLLYYVFLKYKAQQIADIYNKEMKSTKQTYEFCEMKLPESYLYQPPTNDNNAAEVKSEKLNFLNNHYAYELIYAPKGKSDTHKKISKGNVLSAFDTKDILDKNNNDITMTESDPERSALEDILSLLIKEKPKMYQLFKDKQEKIWKSFDKNIKVWFKNPTMNGVSFEYLGESTKIAKSFPDYVIKIGNHNLVVEIKRDGDEQDYDSVKTQDIIQYGFEKYDNAKLSNDDVKLLSNTPQYTLIVNRKTISNSKVINSKYEGISSYSLINEKLQTDQYHSLEHIVQDIINEQEQGNK